MCRYILTGKQRVCVCVCVYVCVFVCERGRETDKGKAGDRILARPSREVKSDKQEDGGGHDLLPWCLMGK